MFTCTETVQYGRQNIIMTICVLLVILFIRIYMKTLMFFIFQLLTFYNKRYILSITQRYNEHFLVSVNTKMFLTGLSFLALNLY
jgi:hypothetical protein